MKIPGQALAWCPWKPDLLATGSGFPEGRISVWSTKHTVLDSDAFGSNPGPTSGPANEMPSIQLLTNVTSLHWSPHCKEILSTHGVSWTKSRSEYFLTAGPSTLAFTILVHSYPSLKQLVRVEAHSDTITHSCLSPDGTVSIFFPPHLSWLMLRCNFSAIVHVCGTR